MDRGKERKKRHLEITREGKQVLALDHVPMQKTVELCQFNLQTPDSTELVDHVVVCHCNLAANGHQVVRYFTERNVSKICFLTETPPKFEVWGDIVTHRPDCQVYFVTGEITDVTVSLFVLKWFCFLLLFWLSLVWSLPPSTIFLLSINYISLSSTIFLLFVKSYIIYQLLFMGYSIFLLLFDHKTHVLQ